MKRFAPRLLQAKLRTGVTTWSTAADRLPTYVPESANYWRFPELTFEAAEALPGQLLHLHELISRTTASPLDLPPSDSVLEASLRQALESRGSDKVAHGYVPVYGAVLSDLLAKSAKVAILELGIGTADPDRISSMGKLGRPGASLKAFRDSLPSAEIYGIDIDAQVLFSDSRIRTLQADQLTLESLIELPGQFGVSSFDLMIDDGLHAPKANLNSVLAAFTLLRPGGWLVVEDIPDRAEVVWKLVGNLLAAAGIQSQLLRPRDSGVFVARFDSH